MIQHCFSPTARFIHRLSANERGRLLKAAPSATPGPDLLPWYCGPHRVGWVSPERAHTLQQQWPQCRWESGRLVWSASQESVEDRSQFLQQWLIRQRDEGLLSGWRGEAYRYWSRPKYPPDPDEPGLFDCERAGFRYLGMRSHAVHINGFASDGDLWCGQRALSKATDPGLLDSLSAGGLSAGQGIWTVLQRELWEEAGLVLERGQALQWLGSIDSCRLVPEGWQHETLWVFNLELRGDQIPCNQDGEVAQFLRLAPREVLERVRAQAFTPDAVLALQLGLAPASRQPHPA